MPSIRKSVILFTNMKWSSRIDKAIETAARMHGNQFRRNGITPYIVHPITVAWMVSEYTDNENTIIAALFHDLIEDVEDYDLEDMENDFGSEVARMVAMMSNNIDVEPGTKWLEKKKHYLKKLENADKEVLLILLMNHLHNLVTMKEELREFGGKFWDKFHSTRGEKYQWVHSCWELFVKNGLPEKPVNKMEFLIDEIYGEEVKKG